MLATVVAGWSYLSAIGDRWSGRSGSLDDCEMAVVRSRRRISAPVLRPMPEAMFRRANGMQVSLKTGFRGRGVRAESFHQAVASCGGWLSPCALSISPRYRMSGY